MITRVVAPLGRLEGNERYYRFSFTPAFSPVAHGLVLMRNRFNGLQLRVTSRKRVEHQPLLSLQTVKTVVVSLRHAARAKARCD
jgi:hypothetical protein